MTTKAHWTIEILVRPIRVLRRFLQQHPETKEFSSQLGIAQLVDRSESLVRAIEGGRMEMSPKFARALSAMTGVSKDWLMRPDVDPEVVPAERGGSLQHNEVVARVRHQIKSNLDDAAASLAEARIRKESGDEAKGVAGSLQQRMAQQMAGLVQATLTETLARGDTRLMEEITRLLARHGGSKE